MFVHRCFADAGIGPCSRRLIKLCLLGISARNSFAYSLPRSTLKMEAIQNFNSSLEVDEVRNYQFWFPETLAHRGSFLVKTEPPYLRSGAGPREDIVENSSNLQ